MKQAAVTVYLLLMCYLPQPSPCQRLVPPGKNFQADEDDYHAYADEIDEDEYIAINKTGKMNIHYNNLLAKIY